MSLFSFFKRSRRKKILAEEFPADWLDILTQNVWQFRFLDASHQQRIKNAVQIMSAEKSWEGTGGLEMSAEIQITISGAASLLTLGFPDPYYFDRIKTIIVHPGVIRNRLLQRGYLVDEDDGFFAGQAWQGGPIVLAWSSVIDGTHHRGTGHNVVIHEFAHHIDGLDGEMGGMPDIESPELRERWRTVFGRDYQRLVSDIHHDRPTVIDPYAGTNKAEFFAVTSELFFDSPEFLRQQLPDVYECLAAFYQLDPLSYTNGQRDLG